MPLRVKRAIVGTYRDGHFVANAKRKARRGNCPDDDGELIRVGPPVDRWLEVDDEVVKAVRFRADGEIDIVIQPDADLGDLLSEPEMAEMVSSVDLASLLRNPTRTHGSRNSAKTLKAAGFHLVDRFSNRSDAEAVAGEHVPSRIVHQGTLGQTAKWEVWSKRA